MNWKRLIDRCKLFEKDAPEQLLKELLKEAEEELCRHIPILERKKNYQGPFTTEEVSQDGETISTKQPFFLLPQDFMKMKYVYCQGVKLDTIAQDEVIYDSNHRLTEARPRGYYIHNDRIYFDTIPAKEIISIEYYAHLTSRVQNKDFEILDTISIPMDNGVVIEPQAIGIGSMQTNLTRDNVVSTPTILGDDDKTKQEYRNLALSRVARDEYGFSIDTDLGSELVGFNVIYGGAMSSIVSCNESPDHGVGWTYSTNGSSPTAGEIVTIVDYRTLAPIVPVQYHKDLCDYALHTATGNQIYYDKWASNIAIIEAQDVDRNLDHNIKEVI